MRVAVGGIHTECSTFNPVLATAKDFRVLRGAELLADPRFEQLASYPWRWFPTLHALAIPGGPVRRETYDAFLQEHLTALKAALPLDGVYLAMHGAMKVKGMDDAEGHWIGKTREVVGPDTLITASYDLHGNLSQRVVRALDMFSAYRTAPHIDVPETQRRALDLLEHTFATGRRPYLAWVPVPVLVSGERSSTEDEPAQSLYRSLETVDRMPGILDASLLVGYVWADEPRATASVMITGTDKAAVEHEALALARAYWGAREKFVFGTRHGSLEECLAIANAGSGLAIIGDSGDNPTGGGVGDRADALAVVLESGARDLLLAGIADEPATAACYSTGVGARVTLKVGATLDPVGSSPATITGTVLFLVDTREERERQAVVQLENNITVVLTARRRPFHRFCDFTDLGLDIHQFRVLLVKSGYLSPELRTVASPALLALTAGVVAQRIEGLTYERWQRPRFPLDRDFTYSPRVFWSGRGRSN